MKRRIHAILLLSSGVGYIDAQTADSSYKFEVVAIRPSPPRTTGQQARGCSGGPGTSDPSRWTCHNMLFVNLMRMAYKLESYQFTPPDWTLASLLEIDAKVPEGATKEQLPLMIQSLLADRFKLAVHWNQKEVQTYQMTVEPGGPKFKEWAEEPPVDPEILSRSGEVRSVNMRIPPEGDRVAYTGPNGHNATKSRQTMSSLAGLLSGELERPVIDATGLKGTYNIMLDYIAERKYAPGRGPAEPQQLDAGPTLFQAVESQLGLKLESKKGMIDMLTIDHVEKTPTEN